MKNHSTIGICTLIVALLACSQSKETEEINRITFTADNFIESYFNYDFSKSCQFCTEESGLWLKFVASNIEQEDIDILRRQPEGASFETKDINVINDSTAIAHYRIYNFMRMDTIGKAGEMTSKADYAITLVKRHGKWQVRMEGPLRSEKRNHD